MQIIPKTILIVLNNNKDNDHRGNQSNQSENNYLKADCRTKKTQSICIEIGPMQKRLNPDHPNGSRLSALMHTPAST